MAEYVRKNITIKKEHDVYVKKTKLNLSRFVQKMLDVQSHLNPIKKAIDIHILGREDLYKGGDLKHE